MGQKVHPSGFRVGITKKHQSQWFARFNKNKYSQTVLEDRMIRDTLNKLFPELLNPSTKGGSAPKRHQNARIKKSRITQIKIERNIVPYQIGIQIHAENCKLLKSSIKNLQVKKDILVKLQKTRQYLTNLKIKLDKLTNAPAETQVKTNFEDSTKRSVGQLELSHEGLNTKLSKIKSLRKKLAKLKTGTSTTRANTTGTRQKKLSSKTKRSISQLLKMKLLRAKLAKLVQPKLKRKALEASTIEKTTAKTLKTKKKVSLKRKNKFETKLTKRQLKRQRVFKKRLKLRKFIRLRDRLLISKGLFLQKKGHKITKKIVLAPTPKFLKDFSLNPKVYLLPVKRIEKLLTPKKAAKGGQKSAAVKTVRTSLQTNIYNSRIQKKFVTMYVEQMKKKFLPHLNELFLEYTSKGFDSNNKAVLSLGYMKQWDFERRVDNLKVQPIEKLDRLVHNLRDKFVMKLNLLRKDFITFGSFSSNSADILGLFQLYNFLMKLKNLVNGLKLNLKHKIKTRLAISKMNGSLNTSRNEPELRSRETSQASDKLRIVDSTNSSLPQKVFRKKLENISNEYRKMKFIEYLKDVVQKHRTDNIYLYLASISESRRKLKEIKNEVKQHLDLYLPGANSIKELNQKSSEDSINLATNEVNNVLMKLAKKHPFDRTFLDCKFEELERRKTMWVQNLQLVPKISIKFFSVNQKALNLKASIVSESVVDALEKRKAFRKVIKTTKENLMRNSEIKGVKIQVAGRLNGAEIARTEWVRAGRVPLQTLRANLDYSYRTANTIYGIIGVKVWIFKGFTKLVTESTGA
uniref:Small ribosomal subunit protein uS3c n=1 Tax=Chlamydomonas moewusii TaxID=3054 RepID=RR3_CHLMO|nr:RecName: Full=Small ribosomal subunit protein uS3c; AltName: Full=30S ribosomal protein S3, chloroplastic [Chlamydomonas moewusii]AAA84159.1 ribosomal protein S3 [Chlamydomonas moewusii]